MMMTIALKCPAQHPAILQAEVSQSTLNQSFSVMDNSLISCRTTINLVTYHSIIHILGSARLYREPVSKTNRPIILNAVEYVVLPGEVTKVKIK